VVEHEVDLHFIDPRKPAQNAWIESLSVRVRDESLNVRIFRNVPEMHDQALDRLVDYNEERPHSSLGYLTPQEFVQNLPTSLHSTIIGGLKSGLRPHHSRVEVTSCALGY
jgi:putative transposase